MLLDQFEEGWRFRTRQRDDRGFKFGEKNIGRGETDPSKAMSIIYRSSTLEIDLDAPVMSTTGI
jgi:hypothetical protein